MYYYDCSIVLHITKLANSLHKVGKMMEGSDNSLEDDWVLQMDLLFFDSHFDTQKMVLKVPFIKECSLKISLIHFQHLSNSPFASSQPPLTNSYSSLPLPQAYWQNHR